MITVATDKIIASRGNSDAKASTSIKWSNEGSVPLEWRTSQLTDLGNVIDGDRGRHYPTATEFSDSGFCLFLNAGNVTKDGFRFGDCVFITQVKDSLLRNGKLQRSDVVLTTRGTVGNLAYYNDKVPYEHIRINSGMVILRKDSSAIYPDFLFEALKSDAVRSQIEQLSFGSAQPQLTVKGISNLSLVVPPLYEQRAIAEALSDVDALIDALDKLIAKKRAIKQGSMQQLLTGKTRLPGFSDEWTKIRLMDLGNFSKGRGIKRDDISSEGVPCIRYGELYTRYRDYVTFPISRIPLGVAETAMPIQTGALLFAGSGETAEEIGQCAAYIGSEQAYVGGDIIVLTPYDHNSIFLGHLMNTEVVVRQKSQMSQGDAVVHISSSNLARIEVSIPSHEEQLAIAAVLTDMDAEIETLEQRLHKTKQIKQGMMQQILTGRTRLVNPQDNEVFV